MKKATVGKIVEFFPGEGKTKITLPNDMESAPAVVTQVFKDHVNLTAFVSDATNPVPVMGISSVQHKSVAGEGYPSWDWPTDGEDLQASDTVVTAAGDLKEAKAETPANDAGTETGSQNPPAGENTAAPGDQQ